MTKMETLFERMALGEGGLTPAERYEAMAQVERAKEMVPLHMRTDRVGLALNLLRERALLTADLRPPTGQPKWQTAYVVISISKAWWPDAPDTKWKEVAGIWGLDGKDFLRAFKKHQETGRGADDAAFRRKTCLDEVLKT